MSVNVTIQGRLGADPEVRFTPAGKAVASFSVVASRPRKMDNGQWEETETTWYRVTAWDKLAENCAESLTKGDAVIVVGRVYLDEWEDQQGTKRQTLKCAAYTVGVDLKRAIANVQRVRREASPPAGDVWESDAGQPPPPF